MSPVLRVSRRLSRSKSFYYISAATLSAVIGLLLVIFYVMKRSGCVVLSILACRRATRQWVRWQWCTRSVCRVSSTTRCGTSCATSAWSTTSWSSCRSVSPLRASYTVIFAFLGVVIVRLNIFTSPSANPTSLFQVVR